MAVLGTSVLTYADWAKRLDGDDRRIATIIELLSQTNEILEDMLVREGNLPTGHQTTVRTGLPTSAWRLLNYGTPVSKSTTTQVVDTCGMLEAESQVDVAIAELNGNTPQFRLSESMSFLESMNQTMASTLMYGNTAVNPERFLGFAPRYNATSSATAQTANNVIDMGGTGSDNTSVWIVTWGENTVHGIFPKAARAGLNHEDMGRWRVLDTNSNPYYAYVDHYKWTVGLTVRDWRFVVRLANIDVSDLNSANAANLINGLVRGFYRLPVGPSSAMPIQTADASVTQANSGNRTAIYCNRVVRTYLDLQAMNKTNVLLRMEEWNGKPVTTFRGVPVRTVDALLNNETRVSG